MSKLKESLNNKIGQNREPKRNCWVRDKCKCDELDKLNVRMENTNSPAEMFMTGKPW